MSLVRQVLFVAWQHPATRSIFPVARLLDRPSTLRRWEFAYIEGARDARDRGFELFHGFGALDDVTESAELPPLFTNRLMRKSRSDFVAYMDRLGLDTAEAELPVLARSEGLRASDPIELFGLPTVDPVTGSYRFRFFLRGVRHVIEAEAAIARIATDDLLTLKLDYANKVDRLAICVHEGALDRRLGWVPATLVEDVNTLLKKGSTLTVHVERVNRHPAPVQMRLLCRLDATPINGFVPFTSKRYQPIPARATKIDIVPEALIG